MPDCSMRMLAVLGIWLVWAGTLPAAAQIIPDCAGATAIPSAHVVQVKKNGELMLDDGRAAILEGIRLPGDPVFAGAALARLRALALGRPLTLTATVPAPDRYGRIRVQAFAGAGQKTQWLQMELLRQGLARVEISPDRNECAPDLYESEQGARAAGAGLWGSGAYAVRAPGGLAGDTGTFQIVEGLIANVTRRDGRLFLDFESDRRGFTATVAPEDMKPFRDFEPPLEELTGRRIRLRGVVESYRGRSEIALSNPAQIEVLN